MWVVREYYASRSEQGARFLLIVGLLVLDLQGNRLGYKGKEALEAVQAQKPNLGISGT